MTQIGKHRLSRAAIISAIGASLFIPPPASRVVRADDSSTRPAEVPTNSDMAAIRKAFAALGSSDPAARSDAMEKLLDLTPDDLLALRQVVKETDLSPAQASVLRQIVNHIYLSSEAYIGDPALGFLGIHMELSHVEFFEAESPEPPVVYSGIVVTRRFPGFPGARALQDGDCILSLLDRPDVTLSDPSTFASVVSQMGAGTAVHFQVLRRGQVIKVSAVLAKRPIGETTGVTGLMNRRELKAAEYWDANFAPLLRNLFT